MILRVKIRPFSNEVHVFSNAPFDIPAQYRKEAYSEGRDGISAVLASSLYGIVDRWVEALGLFKVRPVIDFMEVREEQENYVIPVLVQKRTKKTNVPEIDFLVQWSFKYEKDRKKATDTEWFYPSSFKVRKALKELVDRTWFFWQSVPVMEFSGKDITEEMLDVEKHEEPVKQLLLFERAIWQSLPVNDATIIRPDPIIDYGWSI